MQRLPGPGDARFLSGVALSALEGVDRFEQLRERLAQLAGPGVLLRPADARAGGDEGREIGRRGRERLQAAQAGEVLAQQLRAKRALLRAQPAFEVRDQTHPRIIAGRGLSPINRADGRVGNSNRAGARPGYNSPPWKRSILPSWCRT